MADLDCDFGDCDCDCDFDCCCCCCDDLGWCCGDCLSSDGDSNICCCLICIGSGDSNKHNRDSNCSPCLCCCCDDGSRKRRTPSSDPNWRNQPKHKSSFEGNREERGKKKESGSKHATYPTCYSCGGPIDLPAIYKHQYEHDDSNRDKLRCSRCSSFPESPLEPPGRQEFHRFGREDYFPGYHLRN